VVTPRLTRITRFTNALLNTLAYNPPGGEEGYLFWASWVNHAGSTIFGTQDAHGPIRRGVIITSCSSLGLLNSIANVNPGLKTLFQLLNAPAQSQVCPSPVPPSNPKKGSQAAGGGSQGGDPGSSPTPPREPAQPAPSGSEPEVTPEQPGEPQVPSAAAPAVPDPAADAPAAGGDG
jgi:hypothetical protein